MGERRLVTDTCADISSHSNDPSLGSPDSASIVYEHLSGSLSELDRTVITAVPPGGNWRDLPADFPSRRIDQIRESAAAGKGSRSTYYGRLKWDAPSYTVSTYITRPGNGCFIHPDAPRLITVREAARLQTFPDRWRFEGTLRQRAMQVGNAVPPLLAYQVARELPPGSVVDLFAGAGGLSLGFSLAGHAVVIAVDNDPIALRAYHRNTGHAVLQADMSVDRVRRATYVDIRRYAGGAPDILVGGPPCQGFSTAGHCIADDPRNKLLHAFVDAVEELKPRVVVLENVAALGQSRGQSQLDEARRRLTRLGYNSDVALLHAEAYGVPQRRRRLFLMASTGPLPPWPRPWLRIEEPRFTRHQPYSSPDRAGFTVRDALGDLPRRESESLDSPVELTPARGALQLWFRGLSEVPAAVGGR